jgi:glycerate 2-kinase
VSAAIAGADAAVLVHHALEDPLPFIRESQVVALAVGKAAPAMARGFNAVHAARIARGLAIGTHLEGPLPSGWTWQPSAHPVPDARSVTAARAALDMAQASSRARPLVVLLSGGASALMALPVEGVSLHDKQDVTRQLLGANAPIEHVNAVRKHLSLIKGGRLAVAARGPVLTLAVSDVVGNDPGVIGSGPTVADATTFADALAVLDACGGRSTYPPGVVAHLERGAAGDLPETPKASEPALRKSDVRVIGSSSDAISAGAHAAEGLGYKVTALPEPVIGEARIAAGAYAAALASRVGGCADPICVLSAGETTVRVVGRGLGGRNQEFALALAPYLSGFGRPIVVASVGSDGVDGPTDAAGACVDSTTIQRAETRRIDPMGYLEANNAYRLFDALGDLLRVGRTDTNVGDLQVALVAPAPPPGVPS